jgi:hypothetical protein
VANLVTGNHHRPHHTTSCPATTTVSAVIAVIAVVAVVITFEQRVSSSAFNQIAL